MKRIYQLAVVAGLLVAPFMVSTPAAAAFECEVGFTGPNSENMCVSEQEYTCDIENETTIRINDSTEQEAATGTADVSGNTSGGDAVSGSASNSSGTTYNFTVTNNGETNVCLANKVVPATETPETPEEPEPGKGETVQPTQTATPTALPVTSGDTAPAIFLFGGLAVLGALAFAYRRLY